MPKFVKKHSNLNIGDIVKDESGRAFIVSGVTQKGEDIGGWTNAALLHKLFPPDTPESRDIYDMTILTDKENPDYPGYCFRNYKIQTAEREPYSDWVYTGEDHTRHTVEMTLETSNVRPTSFPLGDIYRTFLSMFDTIKGLLPRKPKL